MESSELLHKLLHAQTTASVRIILESLGDTPDSTIEQLLPGSQLQWLPFGGNASNISTIGLSTKPGKSLAERITNGIDALLEERAEAKKWMDLPNSPKEAAEVWYGRPASGPDTGLFQGMTVATERRINIVLISSGREDSPTVDVIDEGVGIPSDQLRNTILSLQAGNKIKKRYQIGAFGQGGSSTLGFSEYVVVASRHTKTPTQVAFTVIRVLRLDQSYKEDCYAYLADRAGNILVSELSSDSASLVLYGASARTTAPTFSRGTLIRHVGFRLGALSKALSPSPGNLYHYLQYSLFDPILPFRVWDFRTEEQGRFEYVGGSRNRLMQRALKSVKGEEKGDRIQVRHYRPMEFIVPSGSDTPCIGLEYWVVLAYRKGTDGAEVLRANSAELYVQPNHPIVGTLNGQTQGELGNSILKEVGLGLLAKHCIVHIDASAADSKIRRELFSTSREGFKDGPVLESIVASLKRMLEEDEELFAIEKELTERLAKRESAATRDEVKAQVTKLLKEAGLHVSESAMSSVSGGGQSALAVREKRAPYRKKDPLPTLPFPEVTFVRFASPDQHLEVHLQDSELVLIETDADSEFDKRGFIGICSTGNLLEVESKSSLGGGRIRWRLRPSANTVAGATGEVRVFINSPNGKQLDSTISFEVLPARERPSKQGKTQVPPFEIEAIDPSKEEKWNLLWPSDMGSSEAQQKHAYKSQEISGKTWVFYSTEFPPFADALSKLKLSKPELVEAFETAYEVWIAYHAILQQQSHGNISEQISDEKIEELLDEERGIVARVQVKQALQFAEVWKKGILSSA